MTLLRVFIIFMIVAAIVAVRSRHLISSVIGIGTVGLCLMLSFLLLRAPDLAIILLIVEIVTLSAVVHITSREDDTPFSTRDILPAAAVTVLLLVLAAVAWKALEFLPSFGAGYPPAATAMPAGHPGPLNLVTVLAAGSRSLDSIGAVAVLCAVAAGSFLMLGKNRGTKR